MLTRKQHDLLILIHERLQEDGVPPSFEEMKVALDLKSKSGIHRLITALEERGFIRRLPNRARALEVIRLPEGYVQGASAEASPPAAGFTPSVIEGGAGEGRQSGLNAGNVARFPGTTAPSAGPAGTQRRGGLAARYGQGSEPATGSGGRSMAGSGSSMEVPVMGRIAAGVPIAAIQDPSGMVAVPPSMIGMGKHYALEIQGDSMIEAGILDGDTVIIQETNSADLGDIVVALVDDEEATLKRFRKQDGKIALEAANPAYETRILEPARVKVQGRLAGLVRRY